MVKCTKKGCFIIILLIVTSSFLFGLKPTPEGVGGAGSIFDKGGELTKIGRALEKHGSRTGSIYPKATGSVANKNALGNQVLESILNNKNATIVTRHHATLGNILEIKIPGGMGARFSADAKSFIGLLE